MTTMKYVTRLVLLLIVRLDQTITEAFVARLCKKEMSIKMQAHPRNKKRYVCFGKNSRLVAKKAKSVNHFKQSELLNVKKSQVQVSAISLSPKQRQH